MAILATLHQTRRAADYAEDMVREAKDTTVAAVRSANVAERAYANLERPYLFLNYGEFESPPSEPELPAGSTRLTNHYIKIGAKNFGRSPAIITEMKARLWTGTLADLPADPVYDQQGPNVPVAVKMSGSGGAILAPNDAFPLRRLCVLSLTTESWQRLQRDFFKAFQWGEGFSMVLFGYVDYAGLSGMKERIGFCFWYDFKQERFIEQDVPGYNYRNQLEP